MMDDRQDARILRDREASARADRDAFRARTGERKVMRRLVQITNGGSMPASPDHYFLGYPMDVGGSEAEGATAVTAAGSAAIPVVVIGHVPSVGDQLIATAVGGRWVAERGSGSSTKVCVSCNGHAAGGLTVDLYSGSTLVASCTTDATGCCTFTQSGTYTVKVYANGVLAYSASRTLSGTTVSVYLSSGTGVVCCGSYVIPMSLTLTDAAGSLSFEYASSLSGLYPTWTGGHSVQGLSCSVTTPNNVCITAVASMGPVRVCYEMQCQSGSSPVFALARAWSFVDDENNSNTPTWYQDPSGFTPGSFCSTAPPGICGNPNTDSSSGNANPSSTDPFAITFSTTPAGTNATTDPVGGSVSCS